MFPDYPSVSYDYDSIHEVASAKGFSTKKIIYDKICKKLTFAQHLSKGRFRYSVKKSVISLIKVF